MNRLLVLVLAASAATVLMADPPYSPVGGYLQVPPPSYTAAVSVPTLSHPAFGVTSFSQCYDPSSAPSLEPEPDAKTPVPPPPPPPPGFPGRMLGANVTAQWNCTFTYISAYAAVPETLEYTTIPGNTTRWLTGFSAEVQLDLYAAVVGGGYTGPVDVADSGAQVNCNPSPEYNFTFGGFDFSGPGAC